MAKRYDQEELWDLIRHAVALDHPELREAPMNLIVKDLPSHGPTVMGLVVAEPDEDIDEMAANATE